MAFVSFFFLPRGDGDLGRRAGGVRKRVERFEGGRGKGIGREGGELRRLGRRLGLVPRLPHCVNQACMVEYG